MMSRLDDLVPRHVRLMVRSGGFVMPAHDDRRVRRADGGLALGLTDAWAEAERQARGVVMLLGAPSSGLSTALRQLAGAHQGPGRLVDCADPAADPTARIRDATASDQVVVVDHAERLGRARLVELVAAACGATERQRPAQVAIALRRAAFTPELSAPAVLEAHLDPLDAAAAQALLGRCAPTGELWRSLDVARRRDPAALVVSRRPALLQAAAAEWARHGSLAETVGHGAALLAEEAAHLGVPAIEAAVTDTPPPLRGLPVPAATTTIGSPDDEEGRWPDEGPQVQVRVSDFHIAAHPVTNAEYGAFLARAADVEPPLWWDDPLMNQPTQPVVGVSRRAAERFAAWAGGRLPSEAEWERACRAGTSTPRYGPLDAVAWHAGNAHGHPHPVGGRQPNALGLHDMLGNVWEWVADDFHPGHHDTPRDGAAHRCAAPGAPGVLRGGTWADSPRTVRAATRLDDHPGPRIANIGLRLAW